MANRTFRQFTYSLHMMPIVLDCNFDVGASGAVGTVKGPGISSVTRLAAGIYKVKFQDNYYKLFNFKGMLGAPVSGAGVSVGSITPGTLYVISTVGTTTQAQWEAAGVPAGVTAAVGVSFLAAATTSGTGQAKVVGASGVTSVEIVGDPQLQLGPQGVANQGGYVIVKCLGPTASGDTTPIATDPANGSQMYLEFYLSNSSVTVQGE